MQRQPRAHFHGATADKLRRIPSKLQRAREVTLTLHGSEIAHIARRSRITLCGSMRSHSSRDPEDRLRVAAEARSPKPEREARLTRTRMDATPSLSFALLRLRYAVRGAARREPTRAGSVPAEPCAHLQTWFVYEPTPRLGKGVSRGARRNARPRRGPLPQMWRPGQRVQAQPGVRCCSRDPESWSPALSRRGGQGMAGLRESSHAAKPEPGRSSARQVQGSQQAPARRAPPTAPAQHPPPAAVLRIGSEHPDRAEQQRRQQRSSSSHLK